MAADLRYLTIGQLADAYRKKELSPVEVTEDSLARISELDGKLNSYITVTPELALEQAKQARDELVAGKDRGRLQGVPVGLKDLYSTKGILTSGHSKVMMDYKPAADATTTTLMREAGSVLLGKLAMHEFAFGSPGPDSAFPVAKNPWNIEFMPGGSSSGSGTALAAGLCYGSLGSDTGGSIRGPASLCGIVGLKPTYGRVSRAGVLPLSWSLDHAGPMSRTVEDSAIILQAIAGYDPKDGASANVPVGDYTTNLKKGVKGLKVGVPRAWFDEDLGTDQETLAAFDAAVKILEGQGAQFVEIDSKPFSDARNANTLILLAEAYAYHEANMQTRPQDYSSGIRDRMREASYISAADYINAQRARVTIRAQVNDILKTVDIIASPSSARPATRFTEIDPAAAYIRPSYTNPYNLTGLPAISVAAGFSADGQPIGLQIGGRAFDEATVFQAAYAYEAATPWHDMHPPV